MFILSIVILVGIGIMYGGNYISTPPLPFSYSTITQLTTQQIQGNQLTIECEGIVTRVIDGDSIEVESTECFIDRETFEVRLADVDTPEYNESGFSTSKSALNEKIYGKIIGLDIDNKSTYGKYDNVVAVVLLPIDDSTALNVNKWLVDNKYALIDDYDTNEFDPYTWKLWYLWK